MPGNVSVITSFYTNTHTNTHTQVTLDVTEQARAVYVAILPQQCAEMKPSYS